jgi:integrase
VERHRVRFGHRNATIYKRSDIAHSSYFLSVYIREESRQYRVSLKTPDRVEATERATNALVDILARIKVGQRITSVKLGELRRKFLQHLDRAVELEDLSPRTREVQVYRIGLGIKYLQMTGPDNVLNRSVDSISGKVWGGYLDWRLTKNPNMRKGVVRDELLVIGKMFKYGVKESLCLHSSLPVWDFKIEKEPPRRERITVKDYNEVLSTMRPWISEIKKPKEVYNRTMLQHIFLLASHSGMRSGEIFGLKNSDLEVRKSKNEVLIHMRAKTSKVRKKRDILALPSSGGGHKPINYLIRWLEKHQKHRDPDDHVFSTFEDGKRWCRDVFYHSYAQLRAKLKPKDLDHFDLYHCRHFFITNRLLAGESIHLIAAACGTSTKEIERTYSQVINEITMRKFGEKQVRYDREGGFEVITTSLEEDRSHGSDAAAQKPRT